mgnify:CR=1 FL=1
MEHPTFSNIGVTPLSNALGAEINGVDLSQPLEKAQFEDIQKAQLSLESRQTTGSVILKF